MGRQQTKQAGSTHEAGQSAVAWMGTVSEPGGTEMGELDGIAEVAAQADGGVSGGGPGDRLCLWRRPDRSPESMVAARPVGYVNGGGPGGWWHWEHQVSR
jgi:hypothetical protein